jgi:uncharacterized caspase-like protein
MTVKILILDACRSRPYGRSLIRANERGLAVMQSTKGSLIAYATGPGKVASDGTGRNSPFTKSLKEEIMRPDIPIQIMLTKVRERVDTETNGRQTPWTTDAIIGTFFFVP